MGANGRESEELILLTKQFISLAQRQYEKGRISGQEYEKLISKKISFIESMEQAYVCQ